MCICFPNILFEVEQTRLVVTKCGVPLFRENKYEIYASYRL